ncbi:MAG: RHS repeat-associated core domain-containing protein [Verrucomicrobiota bacterium]
MRWVLMLFVILAALMGGEARAVVVVGRAVVSERVGKAETVEERAEALRVESERASRGAFLDARKAAGFVDAGPLMCWFPGGLAVARSDCGDRQAEFSGGTSAAEYTVPAAAGSAWTVPSAPTVQHVRGPDLGGGTKGLLYSLRNGLPKFNRYNGRGDVVAQSDIDGTTTWAASYQADGRRTSEAGTNVERHRACTKEEDPTGLLNEGFRYRDLETGTFISRDPLGHVDGPNVYCYVRQNPWTMWDPEGLWGIGDSNGPVLDYLWDLGGGVVDGGIEAVEGMGHAVAHPIRTAAAVKDGVLAVRDGIGELSSALDAGHVTWGEIGTAYGDGLAEVASDPAKVGKIVGSSAVSLGAGKAAAVGGKLAMAAAVQTNTARTIAVSAVLATTELAPVASGAARGGAIAAQVGTGFTSRVAEAAKTPLVVNEATIAKALEGSTMQTLQGRVSQPMVERYVRMLEAGKTPPPIQVADGVIVNGNHRYVAGRIFGVEPPTVPYPRPSTSVPKPIQQTTVDPADWGGH